jgi:hypothetical protein
MTMTGLAKLFIIGTLTSVKSSPSVTGCFVFSGEVQGRWVIVVRFEEEVHVCFSVQGDNVSVWQVLGGGNRLKIDRSNIAMSSSAYMDKKF